MEIVKKIKENYLLVSVLLLAAFLRLYKISGYMTFLGDEGRDVIIVRRLLVNFDPILIGPGTSIGNMYLGPLYYYYMAPSLLLANLSPVGPAVSIAILGVLTVFLVWLITKEWFGEKGAFLAALLYSLSPTVIIYSKSSWNPNIMPFFALLSIYSIWKVWQEKSFRWLPVLGVSMAFVMQSHYLGLLLAPTHGLFWLVTFKKVNLKDKKSFVRNTIFSGLVFAFLMSPLVIFDFRHDFINYKALKTFFTVRQETVSAKPWRGLPNAWPILEDISTRLLAGRDEAVGKWVALGTIGSLIFLIKKEKFKLANREQNAFIILFTWLGFALLGLSLYKQHIYDHYYGFFFPAPFILFGGVAQVLIDKAKIRGWWLVGVALAFLLFANITNSPLKYPPNYQYQRTQEVARKIEFEAGGERFNLAVIAERNYEDAYQYFLERWRTAVVDIDPLRADETITNQLFVVCEMPKEKCDPTHNPKAEVANFGWTEIADEWDVAGVTLYRLTHTQ